jgi:hypothetical protein
MGARRVAIAMAAAALFASAPAALAVTAPSQPRRLSAAAAESIALRAAKARLAELGISGPSGISLESVRLGNFGRRVAWSILVRTPSFRVRPPMACRPGVYSYCIPSFLTYETLRVLVDPGTGAVLGVTPVSACKPGQLSTLPKPCSTG